MKDHSEQVSAWISSRTLACAGREKVGDMYRDFVKWFSDYSVKVKWFDWPCPRSKFFKIIEEKGISVRRIHNLKYAYGVTLRVDGELE